MTERLYAGKQNGLFLVCRNSKGTKVSVPRAILKYRTSLARRISL